MKNENAYNSAMLVKRRKASEVSSEQNAYLRSLKQHTRKIMAGRFLLLATFLLLWEIAARQKWIDAFIFSSPSDLAETFWDLLWTGNLLLHFGITLGETLLSFFISTFLGICIAILLWWIPSVYEVTEPYWVALNSLPKSALAPILIVWFGNTTKTIIIASVSLTIIVTILTVLNGFQSVEEEKVNLIYALGGSKSHVMVKLLLPYNIPVIMNVLKVNIGLCLIGVIIGEVLSARAGLGYLIIYGSQIFRMNWVILSILILCVLAVAQYQLLLWVGNKISNRFQ